MTGLARASRDLEGEKLLFLEIHQCKPDFTWHSCFEEYGAYVVDEPSEGELQSLREEEAEWSRDTDALAENFLEIKVMLLIFYAKV